MSQFRARMLEVKALKQRHKDLPPTKPDQLNSLGKFKVFWDQWTSYMSVCLGAADCPLSYVFRADEEPKAQDLNWDGDNLGEMAVKAT